MNKEKVPVIQTKNMLYRIEDYSVLMQALALGERIKVNIGRGDIEIFMGEDLELYAKNLAFPNLPDMLYSEELTLSTVICGIVPKLKEQEPIILSINIKKRLVLIFHHWSYRNQYICYLVCGVAMPQE